MGYPIGYPIPSRIIPSHGMVERGPDTTFFERYGTSINRYHTTVWDIRGTLAWDGKSTGYPMYGTNPVANGITQWRIR